MSRAATAALSRLRLVTALLALWSAHAALADDRDNCLYCHQFPGLSRVDKGAQQLRLFYVDPSYTQAHRGPHARLACTDCHNMAEVGVIPHGPVTPVDCTRQCHLVSPNLPERRFSHENIALMLEQSVHKAETLSTLQFSDGPLLQPGQSLCLSCHDEPLFRISGFVTRTLTGMGNRAVDRCETCHATQVRLDSNYFVRHVTSRLEDARPTLEVAQVCAVCHSDRSIRAAHGLQDAVASYVRSFHGKAALLGDELTAGCVSCHVKSGENAHLMLGPEHPGSSVSRNNVANSCRSIACHPGAEKAIADTAVHLDLPTAIGTVERAIAVAFIVLTVFSFGPSAAIVLLELVQLVVGRHAHHHAARLRLVDRILAHPFGKSALRRFTLKHRIQHWVLSVLFILLALTGFPLKFADHEWARATINLFGGVQSARVVHHWSGVLLIAGFALHVLDILRVMIWRARETRLSGKPEGYLSIFLKLPVAITPTDLLKAGQLMSYLLGLRRERPTFGRFSATEKFEYFGVIWGTTLLGITGLMLWFVSTTSQWVTGRVFNIATIMHTYEAFLAVIHVGILHIYNVILSPTVFPISLATMTGETPSTKLAEEHGEFVEEVAEQLGIPVTEANHG